MKHITASALTAASIVFYTFIPKPAISQETAEGKPVEIGTYRQLHSEILGEERTLLVNLPEGYAESSASYPVMYVLYGGQVRGYFAEAVNAVSRLTWEGSIPAMIVVGVANTQRYRDLSPSGRRGNPSGIEPFSRFVAGELIPFVEDRYRTKDFRVLVGPQAGAAFGFYTLVNRKGLFDAFILENPFRSAEVHDILMPMADKLVKEGLPSYTFLQITCADREGFLDKTVEIGYVRGFNEMAEESEPRNLMLVTHFIEDIEDFIPPLRIKEGLRELFRDYRFPDGLEVLGLGDLTSYYSGLSERYGFEMGVPEMTLVSKGLELKEKGEIEEAVEVFEYAAASYPASVNGCWQLANLYREQGDREKAIEYFRKCLEIMPGMPPARHWLEQLGANGK